MPPGDPSLRRLQTCPLRGRLLSMRSSPNRAFAALIGLALIASACTPRGADSSAPDVEVDPATCSSPTLPEMLTTLSSDPEGRITSLSAGMSGVDLATSEFIFVRAEVAAGETLERILIDTDGDRMSGMWSLQSHLSGSGWNYLVDAAGSVHRHRGPPTKWNFETVGDATVRDDNTFCIPISLLGKKPPSSVGIAVETKEGSLPGRFLRGASFPPGTEELATVPFKTPGRLAFNYSGFPWLIDGCPDKRPTPDALRCAVEVYSKFDQLVIDADFTSSAVPGLERMIKLLAAKKPSLEVWGYVSIVGSTKGEDGIRDRVYSPSDIANLAQRFKALGVSGIFLDEYDVCDPSFETCQPSADGVGIPITRAKQVEVVELLHSMDLAAFANGHSVVDALGEIDGVPTPLGPGVGNRPADQYLLENPTLVSGKVIGGIDGEGSTARFLQAIELTGATGVRLAVLDSAGARVTVDALTDPGANLAWWRAAQAGASAFALSAGDSHLTGSTYPALRLPAGAAGLQGGSFAPTPAVVGRGGRNVSRSLLDCNGQEIGAIAVSLGDPGSSGFIPAGATSAC